MLTLLFDIDGTLIHTGGAGMAALRSAFTQEFQVADPAEVPVSGRTDRGIASNLFRSHGVADTDDHWRRFRDAYLFHLEQNLPRKQGRLLPGVSELLAYLAGRDDVQVGLLTGNVREGARLKLEHYAIAEHFAFGGFGDRHPNRDLVAAEALAQSRAHAERQGKTVKEDRVWVIGDTPLDVTCARAIGARAVAVATGSFDRAALEVYQPDLLLDSLASAAPLLAAWQMEEKKGTGVV